MSLIERQSGTIMRFGNGTEHGGLDIYHGRTQREVHPARRYETISFRWEIDGTKQQPRRDEDGWEHYSYRFIYRYLGRTLSITWKCGTGYGTPKPFDGLESAFRDAQTVAWEAFTPSWAADLGMEDDMRKAQRVYNACEAMEDRIATFFGDEVERTLWENIFQSIDNGTEHFIVHTHERIAA